MGGKKKGKKGEDKPKEEPKLIIPDYTPLNLGPLPISVKVRHGNDLYIIYTDEYEKAGDIKEKISILSGENKDDLKLYLKNRRPLEDSTSNHDQQVVHETEIFVTYKGEKINDVLKGCGVEVKPNNNPEITAESKTTNSKVITTQ